MSVEAFKWALEQTQLRGSAKAVLLVLAWRMNKTTGLCCPGVDQIAADCGLNNRTVQRNLTNLSGSGMVDIVKRFGGVMGRKSNRYLFPTYKPNGQSDTLVDTTKATITTDQPDATTDQPDAAPPIKKVKKIKKERERASHREISLSQFDISNELNTWALNEGFLPERINREVKKWFDLRAFGKKQMRTQDNWNLDLLGWLQKCIDNGYHNRRLTENDVTDANNTYEFIETHARTMGLTRRADESDAEFSARVGHEETRRLYPNISGVS